MSKVYITETDDGNKYYIVTKEKAALERRNAKPNGLYVPLIVRNKYRVSIWFITHPHTRTHAHIHTQRKLVFEMLLNNQYIK